jgi:hypothetical protein
MWLQEAIVDLFERIRWIVANLVEQMLHRTRSHRDPARTGL